MAKTLIAYFSHAGQNYSHGSIRNLTVGNTEVVAKKINELIESDMFYIDTVQKYPDDHMQKIEIAKREFNEDARPELTARVTEGLAINGDNAANCDKEVEKWLRKVGLK